MADKRMKNFSTSLVTRGRANHNHSEIPLIPTSMPIIQRQTTSVVKDVEKLEPLCSSGGSVKWHSCCEKQFVSFLKKLEQNYYVIQQFHTKRIENVRSCQNLYTNVHNRSICHSGSPVHGDSPGQDTGVGSMPSSRGSSQPRDRTQVSRVACGFFTT